MPTLCGFWVISFHHNSRLWAINEWLSLLNYSKVLIFWHFRISIVASLFQSIQLDRKLFLKFGQTELILGGDCEWNGWTKPGRLRRAAVICIPVWHHNQNVRQGDYGFINAFNYLSNNVNRHLWHPYATLDYTLAIHLIKPVIG